MSKNGLALSSLIMAIPAGFLTYLCVGTVFGSNESMPTVVTIIVWTLIILSGLLALSPFIFLVAGPSAGSISPAPVAAAAIPATRAKKTASKKSANDDDEFAEADEEVLDDDDEQLFDSSQEEAGAEEYEDQFNFDDDDDLGDIFTPLPPLYRPPNATPRTNEKPKWQLQLEQVKNLGPRDGAVVNSLQR